MTVHTSSKPRFITIPELESYFGWHDLDCRLPSHELTQRLSEELGGIVSLRNLVLSALFTGYAVVPSRGPSNYLTFCRVNP